MTSTSTQVRTVRLDTADKARERPPGARNDIFFTRAQVGAVIEALSRPGDRVLDPFSGYGTAVTVADDLGRIGTGVELQPDRVRFSRALLPAGSPSRIVEGDARQLRELEFGRFELCVTSPPYMSRYEHPENPLTAYRTHDGNYRTYLRELAEVFAGVSRLLTADGAIAVCVGNFRDDTGRTTPLAFDLGHALSDVLQFRFEIVFQWSQPPSALTGDYCLVFGAKQADA